MDTFRQRISTALANESLQAALDANAETRVHARVRAWESLPDWRGSRQRAHAVRADVIEHLEEYLAQFIDKAEKNGTIIHRAKDAAEANRIVLEIVADPPPRTRSTRGGKKKNLVSPGALRGDKPLVAKSKSMVTEEIGLNHALEAQGIRVVETDLGEYIVQLRRERPAHIITPAVHLRRDDVGRTFHEKLGIPYTEDIPTLTEAARRVLREVFLEADVGISGVNFGVAETGSICIVSNEGNARMVSTLPRVHIALMGMERLVRNLDDLALMLSLLARSATGQKLSAYSQLLTHPLGGQERHVIILDNGRTRLRDSALRESLLCIRCGACMNACPVFREIGGHGYDSIYPGPIGSVISAGFFGPDFVPLAQASSLCGSCKEACPVDIDLPKLLTRVRSGAMDEGSRREHGLSRGARFSLGMYSRIARSPRLFAVSQRLAWLATRLLSPTGDWLRLPAATGWGNSKDFPRFASRPFRARFRPESQNSERSPAKGNAVVDAGTKTLRTAQSDIDRVEQFISELTAVSGHVLRVPSVDVSRKVIEFLRARDVRGIHLAPNLLDETALRESGIGISHDPDPALAVGVTRAICGLADTGSIVIVEGEGHPLQASLLPRVHLAILNQSDILPSLADALRLSRVRDARAVAVITGPSRTGDIEMSHTIGVHGPAEVHVLLVDD